MRWVEYANGKPAFGNHRHPIPWTPAGKVVPITTGPTPGLARANVTAFTSATSMSGTTVQLPFLLNRCPRSTPRAEDARPQCTFCLGADRSADIRGASALHDAVAPSSQAKEYWPGLKEYFFDDETPFKFSRPARRTVAQTFKR